MNRSLKAALCLLLSLLLCSCANVVPISDESDDSSDISAEVSDNGPQYDGFGSEVTIATSMPEIFGEGEYEFAMLSQAAAARIDAFSDKYGVDVKVLQYSEDEILKATRTAQEAGTAQADLYCFSRKVTGEMAQNMLLTDLLTLSLFDADASYLNANDVKNLGVYGKLFMITSPSTLEAMSTWCVFYNADITKDCGSDPATLYLNGGWTFDAFADICDAAAQAGHGGYMTEGDEFTAALWTATGCSLLNESGRIPADLSAADTAANVLGRVYNLPSRMKNGGADEFVKGDTAFLLAPMTSAGKVCSSELNWCVVPMPSLGGASRGFIASSALCFSVPDKASDPEGSAVLLNELLTSDAEFASLIADAAVLQYSTDNKQTVMLQKVLQSACTEPAMTFASFDSSFSDALISPLEASLAGGEALSGLMNAKREAFDAYISQMYQ